MFHVSVLSASNLGHDLEEMLFSGHGTFSLEWERTRMCQMRSDVHLPNGYRPGLFPWHSGAEETKVVALFLLMPR